MSSLERLHKVLAHAGFGSRRACEQLIAAGAVHVDGKVITQMGVKVDPERQRIKCGDRYVRAPVRLTYLLNKPRGVVSTTRDERGRKTVLDCLSGVRERLYPAGRLDADSQGMVILTNDGELTARLTHPRYRIPRTYHVILRGGLSGDVLQKMRRGVWLSEGRTGPFEAHILKRTRDATVIEVTLHEGLNREIRRIFARMGYKVRRLKRVRIGALTLGGLPEGQSRRLGPDDLRKLLQSDALPAKRSKVNSEEE